MFVVSFLKGCLSWILAMPAIAFDSRTSDWLDNSKNTQFERKVANLTCFLKLMFLISPQFSWNDEMFRNMWRRKQWNVRSLNKCLNTHLQLSSLKIALPKTNRTFALKKRGPKTNFKLWSRLLYHERVNKRFLYTDCVGCHVSCAKRSPPPPFRVNSKLLFRWH